MESLNLTNVLDDLRESRDGADDSALGERAAPRPVEMQTILEVARNYLGMDISFISEFCDGSRILRHVSAGVKDAPKAGHTDPSCETYCQKIANGELPPLTHDARNHPITGKMPVTEALSIGSYAGVPIVLSDGEVFGTFCCYSNATNNTLGQNELRMLFILAGLAATTLEIEQEKQNCVKHRRQEVAQILDHGRVNMVLQPVVRMDTLQISGFEALARFDLQPSRSPLEIFEQAEACRRGSDMELLCLQKAVAMIQTLPHPWSLSINLSPKTLLMEAARAIIVSVPMDRIVIELTEHSAVEDYSSLIREIEFLRQKGARFAVDDTGSGYANFRHILNLKPDIVKLDRDLVHNIDKDPARMALAEAITTFCRSINCVVVAEGIETEQEFKMVKSLGVDKGQGFFIGRPDYIDVFLDPNRPYLSPELQRLQEQQPPLFAC